MIYTGDKYKMDQRSQHKKNIVNLIEDKAGHIICFTDPVKDF